MEINEERISNRKKAYRYIRTVASKHARFASDTDLADVLGGTFLLQITPLCLSRFLLGCGC